MYNAVLYLECGKIGSFKKKNVSNLLLGKRKKKNNINKI